MPNSSVGNRLYLPASLRREIYFRDGGLCWSCGKELSEKSFHLGHIVERVAGGPDTSENLTVMCKLCNYAKPLHETREQAFAWKEAGGAPAELGNFMEKQLLGMSPEERAEFFLYLSEPSHFRAFLWQTTQIMWERLASYAHRS
jgi:hypothetical protein